MAAMNRGANDGDGAIVGVIHEAFVVDGSDWFEGAHSVFNSTKHTFITAKGNDLQQRKKLLVEGADGLVVLPGGPGTWDELWEMACARHIGFHAMPIVCVNVDGYYDNFKSILVRAHEDELLYKHPDDILHFEETPEAAVKWIETYQESTKQQQKKVIRKRTSMLKRMQSNLSGSSLLVWGRMSSFFGDDVSGDDDDDKASEGRKSKRATVLRGAAIFVAGVTVGLLAGSRSRVGLRKM
jgi:predicted Rossmann-fold nucleotide-binding protein